MKHWLGRQYERLLTKVDGQRLGVTRTKTGDLGD